MPASSKAKRAALRRAINRYRNAAIEDSWKGGGDPENYEIIEEELEQAEFALDRLLRKYLP